MEIMIALSIFVFLLGLAVGSAINALEYRFAKKDKSFFTGRSECPSCKHQLSARDLIPVLSYVFSGGRCRHCGKKIGWHYPAIELLAAVSFLLFLLVSDAVDGVEKFRIEPTLALLFGLSYISILVFILLYDARHMIIPNRAVYALAGLALIGSIFVYQLEIAQIVLGAAIGFGFFGILYAASKGKWIGFGDVKLGLALGIMLGGWLTLLMLFLAYVIGALVVIALLVANKKTTKDKIPFGPFLAFGAIVALLVGPTILNWYIDFL